MANPFDGIVNLSSVDDAETNLVNDLEGVSVDMVDGLLQADETLEQYWTKIKNNALERLIIDFEVLLAEKRDFMHEMAESIPFTPCPTEPFTRYFGYSGAVIEFCYQKYCQLSINEVCVWAQSAGTAQVVVYDRLLLTQVGETLSVNLTQGLNRIAVNRLFPVQMDVELFVGLKTSVNLKAVWGNKGFHGGKSEVACVSNSNTGEDLVEVTAAKGGTWPVHVNFSIKGDINDLVGKNVTKLASAYRYLCAYLLLQGRASSDNHNEFTNTNLLKVEELRDQHHTQYKSQLTKAVKVIYVAAESVSEAFGTNVEHQGGYFLGSYV